jgi:hypothetical protein
VVQPAVPTLNNDGVRYRSSFDFSELPQEV